MKISLLDPVTPAHAGVQYAAALDSGVRRNDEFNR
jgi:hypothetical protein